MSNVMKAIREVFKTIMLTLVGAVIFVGLIIGPLVGAGFLLKIFHEIVKYGWNWAGRLIF